MKPEGFDPRRRLSHIGMSAWLMSAAACHSPLTEWPAHRVPSLCQAVCYHQHRNGRPRAVDS